jgi:MoaA/NifB/PqqE/SkfB family radical SAM enzyme
MIKNELIKKKQEVLTGSSYLVDSNKVALNRSDYMVEYMALNKAYMLDLKNNHHSSAEELLEKYRYRYKEYRRLWFEQPQECIDKGLYGQDMLDQGYIPLCADVETASICDLACEFCYRESLATPDKIISRKLFYSIVDQAAEIGIPSMKLNWRGEPLMNSKLPEMIEYAKSKGILEVIINTNATHLSEKMGRRLIDAGLDLMIYSFDGGTKETYEKMRPGRFRKNSFEDVYGNIVNFSKIREEMGMMFPRTKIQMILTEESYDEQQQFFNLFNEYVDEVTVTQYSERGGNIEDLSKEDRVRYKELCSRLGLPDDSPYMHDADGNISVSDARSPCEQPYQRIMVTYDGRAAMCCFDWGAMHPIGYVSDKSFDNEDADKKIILQNIEKARKGFTLMPNVVMPPKFNRPEKTVQTLKDIWTGKEVEQVRRAHGNDDVEGVDICKKCTFKDTYHWVDE